MDSDREGCLTCFRRKGFFREDLVTVGSFKKDDGSFSAARHPDLHEEAGISVVKRIGIEIFPDHDRPGDREDFRKDAVDMIRSLITGADGAEDLRPAEDLHGVSGKDGQIGNSVSGCGRHNGRRGGFRRRRNGRSRNIRDRRTGDGSVRDRRAGDGSDRSRCIIIVPDEPERAVFFKGFFQFRYEEADVPAVRFVPVR